MLSRCPGGRLRWLRAGLMEVAEMRLFSKRGARAAPAILLVLLAGLVVSSASPQVNVTQPSAAPQGVKQDVRDSLAAMLPSADKRTGGQIRNALKNLDRSLEPGLWVDSWHLGDRGAVVFDQEQLAVEQLLAIKRPSAGVTAAIAALAGVDQQLAQTAVSEAVGGNAKELARANDEMAKAAGELGKGHPNLAIDHYGKAWEHARKAAANPVGAQTFTLRTCAVSELVVAITQANATAVVDTVNLKAGCTYTLIESVPGDPWEGGLPLVVNPLTIHGNSATIERAAYAPNFSILGVQGSAAGGTFAIDHVNFVGGASGSGGAISVRPQFGPSGPLAPPPSLVVTDSTFTDNSTVWTSYFDPVGSGGAISVEGAGSASTVTLARDVFTNNWTHGGPPYPGPETEPGMLPWNSYDLRAGGAVSINGVGETRITDCIFEHNWTGDGYDGGVTPAGIAVRDGGAAGRGGAVFVNSPAPLTVTDSVFLDNRTGTGGTGAGADSLGGKGGDGGALYYDRGWWGGSGSLTLTGDTFTGNETGPGGHGAAQNGSAGDGGAVSFRAGALAVGSSTFGDNTAGNGTDGAPGYSANGSGGGGGGAIFAETMGGASAGPAANAISGSTFTGNAAGFGGHGTPAAGNGGGGGHGGAIVFFLHGDSTLTLAGDTFSGNSAGRGGQGEAQGGFGGDGGGVSVFGQGALTVSGTTLTSNSTGDGGSSVSAGGGFGGRGGGLYSDVPSNVTTSSFTTNHAGIGGGTICGDGFCTGGGISTGKDLTVGDSTFTGNTAPQGGGIWSVGDGTTTITGSTFAGNTAVHGGGAITFAWGTLTVANSTFSGNTAGSGPGGGLFIYKGTARVTNSTLSGNQGDISGGVYNGEGALLIANTILADNGTYDQNCGGEIVDLGGNISFNGSGCPGTFGTGNPNLGLLEDNGGPTWTMALDPGSAAIGTAIGSICAAPVGPLNYGAGGVDQRGVTRPQGSGCDIGAYERKVP